jgi:hypothetical protein
VINEELKIAVFIVICVGVLFLFLAGEMILRCRKQRIIKSKVLPFTEEGLKKYDDFAPGEAIILAWSEPGDFPRWHSKMQEEVRTKMPVLARALDRMVEN